MLMCVRVCVWGGCGGRGVGLDHFLGVNSIHIHSYFCVSSCNFPSMMFIL